MSKTLFAKRIEWPANAGFAAMPDSLKVASAALDLAAGERLFRIGARPVAMYYVVAGEVRLTRLSSAGGEVILRRATRGFLAEASIEAGSYHCDALAARPSTVLRLPRDVFRRCLDEDAAFRAVWISQLSREVRRARAQCERLTLKGAAERVLHFLETEGSRGEVTLAQSRKAWAAELGLSHETLYRTLARLESAGTIEINGPVVRLLRWRDVCRDLTGRPHAKT